MGAFNKGGSRIKDKILTPNIKAHLALIGTNLFFAINYSAVKYFTSHSLAGPFGINVIRVGVSLILFWILFLFKPEKSRIHRKDIWTFILCALTAIALNQMLFIKGLSFTLPIHASLLTLIAPILITVIAAKILKERLTFTKATGLLLGVLGAGILVAGRENGAAGDNIPLGDLLIVLSSVCYAFYFILVKPLMSKYSPILVTRMIFTFGFFLIVPVSAQEFTTISWAAFTSTEWLLMFLIVIPGTFLAYIFNVYGIKILSASTAGAYIYSQPVFAVVISMLFLKEELSIYKILAGCLIFTGVFMANKKKVTKLDNVDFKEI